MKILGYFKGISGSRMIMVLLVIGFFSSFVLVSSIGTESIDRLEENGFIDAEEALSRKQGITKGVTEKSILSEIRSIYDSEGESEAFAHIQDLASEVPEGWNVKDWNTFIGQATAEVTDAVTLLGELG